MKKPSGSSQQINDLLNSGIGFVVSGFDLAVRHVFSIGLKVEPAVGERAAELFVEEQKQQGNLNALISEPIGVPAAIAFNQPMGLEFSQIITELSQAVLLGRQMEGGEDSLMDLLGGPTRDSGSGVKQNFH